MLQSLLSYSSHISFHALGARIRQYGLKMIETNHCFFILLYTFFSAFLFPLEVQLSLLTVLYWPVSRYALGRAYCGGSRLAGGFGGCFRKKLAESWFIAFGVGVIGEGLGGSNQGCSALL